MGFIKEFREFAIKGNAMDMAVGIIIGGAFGIIIKSVIDDLVMPFVGIPGKADFSNLYVGLTGPVREALNAYEAANEGAPMPLAEAQALGPVFAWGNFITVLINFLILAFVVFLIVKIMNKARARFEREKEAAPPPAPPAEIALLTDIRDLLQRKA